MGAQRFWIRTSGESAVRAFTQAQQEARYEYGHGGYTGTIAEKEGFIDVPLPAGETPERFIQSLFQRDDERCCDKWGPAGCVQEAPGVFHFFGYASS